MPSFRKRLAVTVAIATAVGLGVFGFFIAANWLVSGVERDAIVAGLVIAQAKGEFPVVTRPVPAEPSWGRYGIHLFIECQLFGQTLQTPDDRWADAITPREFRREAPPRRRDTVAGSALPCEELAGAARDGAGARGGARKHRYLHGLRPIALAGARMLGVEGLRSAVKWLSLGMGLLAITLSGARAIGSLASSRARDEGRDLVWHGSLALMASAFFVFGGLPLHAPTVTHGIPNALLAGWLALAAGTNLHRLSPARVVGLSALFGAVVVHVDILIGATPLGLAIVVATLAVQPFPGGVPRELVGRVGSAAAAFAVAAVTAMAVKQLVAAAYFGPVVWSEMARKLGERSGVAQYSLPVAIDRFLAAAPALGLGNAALGRVVLACALPLAILPFFFGLTRMRDGLSRARLALLLLSVAVVGVWYLVFWNHAAQHAYFMINLLGWPIAVGVAVAAMPLLKPKDRWRSAAEGRRPAVEFRP